jgi:hypothetical protein
LAAGLGKGHVPLLQNWFCSGFTFPDAARIALRQLLSLKPEFAASARQELGKTWDSEFVEHLMDGLRRAGLEAAGDEGPAAAKPAASPGS